MNVKLLDNEEMVFERDWRRNSRSPTGYRSLLKNIRGNSFVTVVLGILAILFLYYLLPKKTPTRNVYYNATYPLTAPIVGNGMLTFRIGIIADLDTDSKSAKEPNTWFSYFKKGYLSYNPTQNTVVISWDENEPVRLTSSYALKDRGLELSELVIFDGKLLSFDDRTGLIYEIVNDKAVPWLLLMDGDGRSAKGFKSEWATVKDEILYVGSMGKEWTSSDGVFGSYDPMYVKVVSPKGEVRHLNWVNEYKQIRGALDIQWPGYMIHESGVWSPVHKRWFFLPRRCSKLAYNEVTDEVMGCSYLISANEHMDDLHLVKINNLGPARGFSSFKFVPNSEDTVIVALRTEELDGKTATYVTCFTIQGDILVDDTLIADLKYEGLEFI